jgi:hypothetical protein
MNQPVPVKGYKTLTVTGVSTAHKDMYDPDYNSTQYVDVQFTLTNDSKKLDASLNADSVEIEGSDGKTYATGSKGVLTGDPNNPSSFTDLGAGETRSGHGRIEIPVGVTPKSFLYLCGGNDYSETFVAIVNLY